MPTQVQTIIDQGRARSDFNDGSLASPQELVAVIDRQMKKAYSAVAKVAPRYFQKRAPVGHDFDASGWYLPPDLEVLTSVFLGKERVHVVPLEETDVQFPPRVIQMGRLLVSVGEPHDPTEADTLVLVYSHQHPTLTGVGQTLHPSWPQAYDTIPTLAVSIHLARKDGREGEVASLSEELAAEMVALQEHAQGHALAQTAGNQ